MTRPTRQLLVLVALIATIAMNAAANLLPLNGRNTGEIANQFMIFITPAGYVFSIWSLIYVGLIAYAVYQLTPAGRRSVRVQRISLLFVVSCIANMVWLELWHYGYYVWTLAAMLTLLASLVCIYLLLRASPAISQAEKWCVDYPFSLYVGWVTVATLVNLSVVLDVLGARPFGMMAATWAIVMIALAATIALLIGFRRKDAIYLAVVAWALEGIALKAGQPANVVTAAWVGTIAVALYTLWILRSRMRNPASR